jgi:hypothetical protein
VIFPLAWGATLYRPTGVIAPRAKPSAPRAEPRGGTVHRCSRLGFARRTVFEPSRCVHPERSRVHPERRRGVGPYTGVLVSASLDEQFMSEAEVCTPSGAEGCFTFQVCALLFEDISPLQDNSDSILLRVAKTYLHDEILWYALVHE